MPKTPEKEIYLVRHGETDYNRKGIIQGRGVNSHLNEKGQSQARAFFEYYGKERFDHVFTSNLIRTQQTLAPFAEAGYELMQHAGLDEIDWGHHEGRGGDPKLTEEYLYLTGRWKEGFLDDKIPGGESPLELQKRQLEFLETVLPNYGPRVLICSHGRAIRALLCTMLQVPLSRMDEFPHTNTSLYRLKQIGDKFEIIAFNSTIHLI